MTGATIPEGSVVITPIEMYREMQAMNTTVQSMSGKLDAALSDHSRRMDDMEKDVTDHEGRLRRQEQHAATKDDVEKLKKDLSPRVRSLEKSKWAATGAASVLSGSAAALLSQLFTKH